MADTGAYNVQKSRNAIDAIKAAADIKQRAFDFMGGSISSFGEPFRAKTQRKFQSEEAEKQREWEAAQAGLERANRITVAGVGRGDAEPKDEYYETVPLMDDWARSWAKHNYIYDAASDWFVQGAEIDYEELKQALLLNIKGGNFPGDMKEKLLTAIPGYIDALKRGYKPPDDDVVGERVRRQSDILDKDMIDNIAKVFGVGRFGFPKEIKYDVKLDTEEEANAYDEVMNKINNLLTITNAQTKNSDMYNRYKGFIKTQLKDMETWDDDWQGTYERVMDKINNLITTRNIFQETSEEPTIPPPTETTGGNYEEFTWDQVNQMGFGTPGPGMVWKTNPLGDRVYIDRKTHRPIEVPAPGG